MVQVVKGTTISIGTTAADATADSYTLIGSFASLSEIGAEYADVPFENLGTGQVEHNTGALDAGSMALGVGRDMDDAGQAAVLAANGINLYYNFKVIYPDATFDYFKAKVQGFTTSVESLAGNLMAAIKLQPDPNAFDLDNAAAAPTNTVVPSITGASVQVGVPLTVNPGEWTGAPTYTYQWQADNVNIAGATNAAYTPVVGDIGAAITCEVTGTNAAGNATAESLATANVIAA